MCLKIDTTKGVLCDMDSCTKARAGVECGVSLRSVIGRCCRGGAQHECSVTQLRMFVKSFGIAFVSDPA
jgi:hypothetical protein